MNANYISKTENSRQLIAVFEGKKEMAGVTGLEPAASGVTGQRSNQLSYTPKRINKRGALSEHAPFA